MFGQLFLPLAQYFWGISSFSPGSLPWYLSKGVVRPWNFIVNKKRFGKTLITRENALKTQHVLSTEGSIITWKRKMNCKSSKTASRHSDMPREVLIQSTRFLGTNMNLDFLIWRQHPKILSVSMGCIPHSLYFAGVVSVNTLAHVMAPLGGYQGMEVGGRDLISCRSSRYWAHGLFTFPASLIINEKLEEEKISWNGRVFAIKDSMYTLEKLAAFQRIALHKWKTHTDLSFWVSAENFNCLSFKGLLFLIKHLTSLSHWVCWAFKEATNYP